MNTVETLKSPGILMPLRNATRIECNEDYGFLTKQLICSKGTLKLWQARSNKREKICDQKRRASCNTGADPNEGEERIPEAPSAAAVIDY